MSLAAARKARDAAKAQRASGINPIQARQVVKLKAAVNTGDTFREAALEWFDKHRARWSGHYATREKRNLEKDLFPYFAARRISEIEPIELLAALRRVEERGALERGRPRADDGTRGVALCGGDCAGAARHHGGSQRGAHAPQEAALRGDHRSDPTGGR